MVWIAAPIMFHFKQRRGQVRLHHDPKWLRVLSLNGGWEQFWTGCATGLIRKSESDTKANKYGHDSANNAGSQTCLFSHQFVAAFQGARPLLPRILNWIAL